MKKQELLAGFFDERFTVAFEEALHNDKGYMDADADTSKALENLFCLGLNKDQKYATDLLVAAHNYCANEYGRVAYQCGFEDAIKLIALLYEIGSGD